MVGMVPFAGSRDWTALSGQNKTLREQYFLFTLRKRSRSRHTHSGRVGAEQPGYVGTAVPTNKLETTMHSIGRLLRSHHERVQKEAGERMKMTSEKQGKSSRTGEAPAPAPRRPDNWRETIESVVVAFVLAFLFRTFEAEAFVIPTGSMAPTLYGQHRDIECEKCRLRFAVGVSSPPSPDAEVRPDAEGRSKISPAHRSHFAICPNANCRFPNNVLEREMFAGDRILVNKFPYEFTDPQRWDVVVFKFPEQSKTNYIKRLAGLPGEELKIEGGDVKVRKIGSNDVYQIARKPPDKQRQLQLLVHDNDHPAHELLDAGWPEAWAPELPTTWSADTRARTFRTDPDAANPDKLHWLRYTHYLPTAEHWTHILAPEKETALPQPHPQHIKDFYAYNGRITVDEARSAVKRGELPPLLAHDLSGEQWVGDLTLNCTVEVMAIGGELHFELVEGHRRHLCTIDLKTGRGAFWFIHEMDRRLESPKPDRAGEDFETGMNKPADYAVSFANVDDRLCLWVDGRLVNKIEFEEESVKFPAQKLPISPGEQDKSPVAIAARGAKVRVSHLKIERDIFYRNEFPVGQSERTEPYILRSDPDDHRNDEFLMLGDNSPRSNDSRLWNSSPFVPRHLLIGKAFYVYWPHGVPFLNDGRGYAVAKYYEPPPRGEGEPGPPLPKFSIPFYPQVGRMHRIR
jgi:signal peptidase I